MSGALLRRSRAPGTTRTSQASPDPPDRCVPRVSRAPRRPASGPARGRSRTRTSWPCATPLSATGQPGLDLLEQPAVAVRVGEGDERAVVGAPGCRACLAPAGPGVVEDPGHVVERLADVDASGDEVGPSLVYVVDRELEPLRGA